MKKLSVMLVAFALSPLVAEATADGLPAAGLDPLVENAVEGSQPAVSCPLGGETSIQHVTTRSGEFFFDPAAHAERVRGVDTSWFPIDGSEGSELGQATVAAYLKACPPTVKAFSAKGLATLSAGGGLGASADPAALGFGMTRAPGGMTAGPEMTALRALAEGRSQSEAASASAEEAGGGGAASLGASIGATMMTSLGSGNHGRMATGFGASAASVGPAPLAATGQEVSAAADIDSISLTHKETRLAAARMAKVKREIDRELKAASPKAGSGAE